jgi:hypothetical protein
VVTADLTSFVVPKWAVRFKASVEEGRNKVKFEFRILDFHNLRSLGEGKRGV